MNQPDNSVDPTAALGDNAKSAMTHRVALMSAIAVAALVVALDQITKAWAVQRLDLGSCVGTDGCVEVFWKLRFHLTLNPGASFSSFSGGGQFLGLLAVGMSILLFVLAYRTPDKWLPWLFGLIAGGALGNLADRAFRAETGLLTGKVIDFIDFQFWPIFNIADMAVVGGVIVLAIRLYSNDNRAGSLDTDEPIPKSSVDAEDD